MKKGLRLEGAESLPLPPCFQTTDLMKKGLRQPCRRRMAAAVAVSDHRPDEEGIKTDRAACTRASADFQTTDLMKKGLRHVSERCFSRASTFQTTDLMKKGLRPPASTCSEDAVFSDHRPDEEGIKTDQSGARRRAMRVSDHRPDEEGIKTSAPRQSLPFRTFQTTDLMKKGLRRTPASPPGAPPSFQTTDLMKKGLRPAGGLLLGILLVSDHRPDEEGIKTPPGRRRSHRPSFRPQT